MTAKIVTPVQSPTETVSFGRGSANGTYFDRAGSIQTAATDELRYTFNPDTREFEGVLIEPQRTNYFLNSSNLSGNFSRTVPSNSAFVIVSFLGTGTITVTSANDDVPDTGLVIGDGSFKTHYAVIVREPGASATLTFDISGVVRYANLEVIPNNYNINISDPQYSGLAFASSPALFGDYQYMRQFIKPTSWIPTTSTIATRAPDTLSGFGIIDSDFVESALPYNPATEYDTGDLSREGDAVYESLTDTNTGNMPSESPDDWLRVRTANDVAFLDLERGGRSTRDAIATVSTRVDQLLSAMSAIDVNVGDTGAGKFTIFASRTTALGVYTMKKTVTKNMVEGIATSSYMDGFIDSTGLEFGADVFAVDVQTALDINGDPFNASDEVGFAELVTGTAFEFGSTEQGANTRIKSFSKKEEDEFGQFFITRRGFRKEVTARVFMDSDLYNATYRRLALLESLPAVFVFSEDDRFAEGLIVFGYYRDFDILIPYPNNSLCNLIVEGLVI